MNDAGGGEGLRCCGGGVRDLDRDRERSRRPGFLLPTLFLLLLLTGLRDPRPLDLDLLRLQHKINFFFIGEHWLGGGQEVQHSLFHTNVRANNLQDSPLCRNQLRRKEDE